MDADALRHNSQACRRMCDVVVLNKARPPPERSMQRCYRAITLHFMRSTSTAGPIGRGEEETFWYFAFAVQKAVWRCEEQSPA